MSSGNRAPKSGFAAEAQRKVSNFYFQFILFFICNENHKNYLFVSHTKRLLSSAELKLSNSIDKLFD